MELLLSWINAAACGLISIGLIGAILSPRVHDGIVVKIGLISMATGFGAIALRLFEGVKAEEIIGLERAILLVNSGIAVVIFGYLMRKAKVHHPVRRVEDWVSPSDSIPEEQRS